MHKLKLMALLNVMQHRKSKIKHFENEIEIEIATEIEIRIEMRKIWCELANCDVNVRLQPLDLSANSFFDFGLAFRMFRVRE